MASFLFVYDQKAQNSHPFLDAHHVMNLTLIETVMS